MNKLFFFLIAIGFSSTSSALQVQSGQDLTGSFAAGSSPEVLTVNVQAGGTVFASFGNSENSQFEPIIEIFNPDGSFLAGTSLGRKGGGISVGGGTLQTGVHTIVLTDFANNDGGSYFASVVVVGGVETTLTSDDNGILAASGSDFQGTLVRGDTDVITVEAESGATIFASLGNRGNSLLRTVVQIYDPSGSQIGFSVIGSRGEGSIASGQTTQTGSHTIILRDFNSDEEGDYHASVVVAEGTATTLTSNDNHILAASGSDFQGSLVKGDIDVITVDANSGATIFASLGNLASSSLDPVVQIFNPDGSLLTSSGIGSSGSGNISAGQTTQTGIHTIVLSDHISDEEGDYHASVVVAEGSATTLASDDNHILAASGSDFQGSLVKGDTDVITVNANSGATLFASLGNLASSSLDPIVQIFNPDGSLLTSSNIGSSGSGNITAGRTTQTGIHTIVLYDNVSDEEGDYFASVVVAEGSATTLTSDDNHILAASGSDFRGSLVKGDIDVVTVDAKSGATIIASLGNQGSSPLDPIVQIFNPDGSLLADSGIGNSGAGNLTSGRTSQTGTHTIVLSDHVSDEEGDYHASVVVAEGSATTLTSDDNHVLAPSGSDFQGTLIRGDTDVVTVSAKSGDTIFGSLGNLSSVTLDPTIQIFNPDGSLLSNSGIGSRGEGNLTFAQTSQTGTHTIVFFDFNSDADGDYSCSSIVAAADAITSESNFALTPGEPISELLRKGDLDVHVIAATNNDLITLDLVSGDQRGFVPLIAIVDSLGNPAQISNREITTFTATETQDYFLVVFDTGSDTAGTYDLTVSGFTGNRATVIEQMPAPQLEVVTLPDSSIQISWPIVRVGWTLHGSSTLQNLSFLPLASSVDEIQNFLVVEPVSGSRFFRLEKE